MLKNINKIFSIIMLISFIIFVYFITVLNILPNKYYFIVIGVLVVFGLLFGVLGFKIKRGVISIIVLILLIIFTMLSFIGSYYIYTTNHFLNNLDEVVEKSVYYVIVKKDSNYSNISDLNDKSIALLDSQSNNYKKALKKVKSMVNVKSVNYTNINTIFKDLLDDKVDSMLINSNNKEMLDEYVDDFKDNTRIIKKVSIDVVTNNKEESSNEYGPFNILISGIDTSGDIGTVSRSDVNIILTVNPNTHEVVLTSVPRDMYVQLHGTTGIKDKLTHAGIYGVDMSLKTLEDFLDIEIQYYVRVNFDSVVKLVDAIGGIDINNDVAFKGRTRYFGLGNIHLNGKQALEYCRERYKMPSGDWTRGLHQEEVIRAIITKVTTSTELLTNYSKIMTSLEDFFQTSIPADTLKKYVKDQIDTMTSWEINSYAVGGSGYTYTETYSMPGVKLYVTLPNEEHRLHASKVINSVLDGKKYDSISW